MMGGPDAIGSRDGTAGTMTDLKHVTGAARRRRWLGGLAGAAALSALAFLPGTALGESSKAPSFQPETPSGAYLAARHAERIFALSEAATLYARALADDPNNDELLARTLYLMVADGRIDAALPLARRSAGNMRSR
jgi:hypothetical protein